MMNRGFDPYDILIEVTERLQVLEIAHNKMADALHKTDQELQIALHSLRHLQQKHISLSSTVGRMQLDATKKNDI